MAGNTVNLEFAGDAAKLAKASKQASAALDDVGKASLGSGADMKKGGDSAGAYLDKIGKLGAGLSGVSGAFDDAGAAMQAVSDLQSAGRDKAMRLARAQADVEQAMIDQKQAAVDLEQATRDLSQSQIDGKQAAVDETQAVIDRKQAMLDSQTAMTAYNDAVKEHGKGSADAKQALVDLAQANNDAKQANVDLTQAQEDAKQAALDGTQATVDATQATRDGKDAQLNLNDALAAANPTGLQQWADKLNMLTPIMSGLTAVVGLATAAQWALNAATFSWPVVWIVAAVAAVIAGVVLLVKHWDVVKRAGGAAWDWIKMAAGNTWDFLKKIPGWLGTAFGKVAQVLTWPFRTAFNAISDLWNNTVGRLHWSVPGWVPGIGGNSISVPNIPRFHTGGTVPGPVGQETLAILTGGETVSSTAGGDGMTTVIVKLDADVLIEALARRAGRRGGNAQLVFGGARA